MATIQIRDIPEDAYETIRLRARKAGKSIQSYMRDHIVEFTSRPSKDEAIATIQAALKKWGPAGATAESIVEDVHAERH